MWLQSLLEEVGCHVRELQWPDHWYFGSERRLVGPGVQVRKVLQKGPHQLQRALPACVHSGWRRTQSSSGCTRCSRAWAPSPTPNPT